MSFIDEFNLAITALKYRNALEHVLLFVCLFFLSWNLYFVVATLRFDVKWIKSKNKEWLKSNLVHELNSFGNDGTTSIEIDTWHWHVCWWMMFRWLIQIHTFFYIRKPINNHFYLVLSRGNQICRKSLLMTGFNTYQI